MSTPDALSLVNPVIDLTTIAITATSAAYVARQKSTEYNQVKDALVAVHALYIALVSLEFIRIYYATPEFMQVYTIGNTTFVLLDVALLTIVALTIYYKPKGAGLGSTLRELSSHRAQFSFFVLFSLYLVAAEVALVVYRPFTLVELHNLVGSLVNSTVFNGLYLNVLLGILIIFIVYPSTLLFIAGRRATDPVVKRALILLPISWIGIGAVILTFNGYVLTVARTDDSAIAYLIAATAFSTSASIFRRATVLSGFFTYTSPPTLRPIPAGESSFSGMIGQEFAGLLGKEYLLEVDPVSTYEQVIKNLSSEFAAEGYVVFAFTCRGSPVQTTLSVSEGVRFLLLTEKVSYPRPGTLQNEMLVPRYEPSTLLNVIDKTISGNRESKLVIVFDSLTDMILTTGLEATYKFIKQANALLSASRITAMFLMTTSALGAKETNVVRSLFNERLQYGESGLTSSA